MRWLRRENPEAARRLREAVIAAAWRLGEQPLMGPERPDLAPPPARFLLVRGFPYLLVYDPSPGGSSIILRVLHAARDIPPLLRRPDEP